MDTKQAQINTFTDGLNTDLHPLTTPNTMLTDCINGTVITYNGNEYILQNDMGNYVLEKAKLWADYIPIGVKEYGNIIYIVSYNPIDKKCQIGSYPSPQTLFDNADYGSKNENYQGVQVYTLDPNWSWPTDSKWILSDGIVNSNNTNLDPIGKYNKEVLFTNTKPNQNIRIFFPEGADIKETFLNPGDKYYLKKEDNEDSHWKFQRCEYYTLTESKEAYKLEDGQVISEPHDYAPERLKNVTWEVPGWLGYKPSLIEPSSFDLYLTDIKIPSFLTSKSTTKDTDPSAAELSFDVQGQLTISTIDDWEGQYDKLKVYFDYKFANKEWQNDFTDNRNWITSEEKGNPTNYGNTIDILTFNISKKLPIKQSDIDTNKTIIIRATPYIIDELDNSGIVYDNLTVTYTINLGDLYNISDIEALTIYKYLSDDEGVTINFDIISPTSNLKQITCKYRIHEIQDGFTGVARNTGYEDIDSLNLLGQNILTLDYDNENDENGWFHKEEIYVFELAFFDIEDWNKNKQEAMPIYQVAEFLITSSVLNDFYIDKDQYQKITLREWTSNIKKYITVDKSVQIGELKDTESYCRYVKVYNPKSIFTQDYYKTLSDNNSWIVNNPENPNEELTTESTNKLREEAVTKILQDEKNTSSATYYGTIGSYVSRLSININIPTIFNNEGMWNDINWNTDVTYTIKNTTDGVTTDELFNSLSLILNKNKQSIADDSIHIVNTSGIFNLYNTNIYDGNDYKRWYLYRNLTYLDKICEDWIQSVINENQEILSKDLKNTLLKLKELKNNSGVVSVDDRKAITFLQSSSSANRARMYLMLKSAAQYNFDNFTLKGHYYDNDGDVLSKEWPKVEDFDNYFSRRLTSNNTFIPVYFDTNTRGGNGGEPRKWTFPDKPTPWHASGDCDKSVGFAILCKDAATISVAIIRAFGETDLPEYAGTFKTPRDGSIDTQFLITSKTKTRNEYISKNMLWNFAMYMLALGVQIYGVYDVKAKSKNIIIDSSQTTIYNSNKKYNISYKRTDLMDSFTYKTVNLFDEVSLKKLELNQLKISAIGNSSYVMSYNNIIGDERNLYKYIKSTVTTNSSTEDYIFPLTMSILDTVHTDFIYTLNYNLQSIIEEFINSKSYTNNTVVCDLHSNSQISRHLEEFASGLTFEYKNKKGFIYYKGLPENTFGGRYDDHYFNDIRYLEWMDIPWHDLYEGFILSSKFIETELK